MDILAAKDQENLVHSLQAAAASKPLNAGLKGLHAKTPGNKAPKTPFKVPLNDENAFGNGGKSVLQIKGKGNENALMTVKKDGKLDSTAFITPAGPRTRAPLGMKTTNAKAKAFQTPAPLSASAKTQKASPRLRRPKVKVQPDVQNVEEDDVPEVEYMPPKEVPLLNDMDDYLPRDWKIPKLENGGVWEAYHNPLEDDGRTKLQRQFEEGLECDRKKRDDEFDRLFNQQWERDQAEAARYLGAESPKKAAPKPTLKSAENPAKKTTGPSTLKARSAAAALSGPRSPASAAPIAATKSRLPSKAISSKKPTMNPPSATRHAAATAASKSTIGYAQGREHAVNRHARKPLSNVTKPAPFSVTANRPPTASSTHNRTVSSLSVVTKPRGPFSRSSSTSTNVTLVARPQEQQAYRTAEDVERELELMLLRDDDEEDEEAWANSFNSQLGGGDPFDEDLDGFQLQLPEGL